jgi:hypothetical protein
MPYRSETVSVIDCTIAASRLIAEHNGELAHKAMSLCGHISITAIAREVGDANKYLEKDYPVD